MAVTIKPSFHHVTLKTSRLPLVADLFVPGLSELTREEGNFVSDVWTAKRPVRLVTARTVLLAGLSHFLADPVASFRRVRDAGGGRAGPILERWISALPLHARPAVSS